MKPPADEAPTEVELEVARILCKLPELVHKAESRRFPDFLCWGGRGRRSAIDSDIVIPDSPPPSPSISLPPHGNVERKHGDRGCGGGATSSPSTPLSFPASGGEEPNGRPPRPPSSPPSEVFKTTKQHREMVAQQQQQQQDGGSVLAPLGPITPQSLVDPNNQRWKIPPPPVAWLGWTPSTSVVAVGRLPEKRMAFDLNASPEEEEEEEEEERSSAYKAPMSAQAKKRMPEIIQHEKNNNSSSFNGSNGSKARLR